MAPGGFLIDANTETVFPALKIDVSNQRPAINPLCLFIRQVVGDGIEPALISDLVTKGFETFDQQAGQPVDTPCDALQSIAAMIYGVHARHYSQQGLCGTDVAGRIVPAYMLLPGLKSHTHGGLIQTIFGNPDNTTRY